MLASVTGPAEAAMAVEAGADLIDFKDPDRGALGAVAPDTLASGVGAVAGRRPVSATVGDPPMPGPQLRAAVRDTAAAGVDFVKVGLAGSPAELRAALDTLVEPAGEGVPLVAVLFADREPDIGLIPLLAAAGFRGVMLDTAGKAAGPLPQHRGSAALAELVEGARAAGLLSGLAGSLRAEHIPPLLDLAPDFLGFRGALCGPGGRTTALDPASLADIRTRIPAAQAPEPGAAASP
jgi:dihydroneopterin aldolase